jgi:electron transfer flavoprotein beta subunit
MASKKAVIPTWKATDLNCDPKGIGLEGSPTKVVKIFTPPPRSGGQMLKGEPDEIIPGLVAKLKDAVLSAAN